MNNKDIFSKIASRKNVLLYIITGGLLIFALIGVVMVFTSKNLGMSFSGILYPLFIYGIATIMSIDTFRRLTSDKKTVRVFGLITLILGVLAVILLSLVFWQIIPMYETVSTSPSTASQYDATSVYSTTSSYSSYSAPATYIRTTLIYKIVMLLPSIVTFTFGGAVILDIKENQKVLRFLKPVSFSLLSLANIIWIITTFIEFDDLAMQQRVNVLQYLSWAVAIILGITAYYLSRSTAYDLRELSASSEEKPKTPHASDSAPLENEPTPLEVKPTPLGDIPTPLEDASTPPSSGQASTIYPTPITDQYQPSAPAPEAPTPLTSPSPAAPTSPTHIAVE